MKLYPMPMLVTSLTSKCRQKKALEKEMMAKSG
jgi:hypothetical protein